MKKKFFTILFFTFLTPCLATAQKNRKHILKSTNIKEIEEYLEKTHPEDPKRNLLKSKLIALKNQQWTLGKKDAKPMESRPVIAEIPTKRPNEIEEFKRLMSKDSKDHNEKTAKLLNSMFDEDITRKEAIFLFKNDSDCNLILKIQGEKFYNMAVPAHDENFIVIKKGSYTIESNVCDVKYQSKKDIKKNIILSIGNPEQIGTQSK